MQSIRPNKLENQKNSANTFLISGTNLEKRPNDSNQKAAPEKTPWFSYRKN